MEEIEINLKSLLFYVLNHWISIAAAMIICGVLAGGYSYYNADKAARQQQAAAENVAKETKEDKEVELETLKEKLSDSEIAMADSIFEYEKEYAEYVIRMEKSALLSLDPYEVSTTDISFFIKAENIDDAKNIKAVYKNLIGGTELRKYISDAGGIAADEAGELVSLKNSSSGGETDEGDSVLEILIYAGSEEQGKKLSTAVKDFLRAKEKELQDKAGVHELILTSEAMTTGYSAAVANSINSARGTMISLANTVTSYFTDDIKAYYDKRLAMESGAVEAGEEKTEAAGTTETAAVKASVSPKYILIGIVAGAFLMACLWAFIYIVSNKLDEDDDLGYLYKIPDLGHIPAGTGRGLLFKLRNIGKRRFETDEAIRLAAVGVKMAEKRAGADSIVLIGCNLKNGTLDLAEKIKEEASGEGLNIEIIDNILYDAENLEKIYDKKGAVILEKAQSTLRMEIFKELDILNRQEIKVLGGIVQE